MVTGIKDDGIPLPQRAGRPSLSIFKCNAPCLLGDKHIAIKKSPKFRSIYFNYKDFFLVILVALLDVDKFIWIDIGNKDTNWMNIPVMNQSISFLDEDPLLKDD